MAAFIARLYKAITKESAPLTDTPFTDVPPSSFAYDDIGRIYGLGITKGTDPTTYSPQQTVSREQMAAFIARLYRAADQPEHAALTLRTAPQTRARSADAACGDAVGYD